VELSADDRELLLDGLAALAVDRDDGDPTRERCRALARELGGDLDARLARDPSVLDLERVGHLPGMDDEPDGIYFPYAIHVADDTVTQATLAQLFADCVTNGAHHLATLDHPDEGMVIGCTHCHRYWRTRNDA
jgi:hypothetical protein